MESTFQKAAASYVAPKVMRNFKLRWVIYGAAAYYGLKLMNKRGILPNQTGAALGFIDKGIDLAKRQIGFGGRFSGLTSSTASNNAISGDTSLSH